VNHPQLLLRRTHCCFGQKTGRCCGIDAGSCQRAGVYNFDTHDNRILDIADRIVEMEDGYLTSNANLAAASG